MREIQMITRPRPEIVLPKHVTTENWNNSVKSFEKKREYSRWDRFLMFFISWQELVYPRDGRIYFQRIYKKRTFVIAYQVNGSYHPVDSFEELLKQSACRYIRNAEEYLSMFK